MMQNEVPNAAPSTVVLEAQSSPVRRRLSAQVRVAIDDTIERNLRFEDDDKGGVSACEGKREVNIDNGNIESKTASLHGQLSSQVNIAIDDTIKRILFLEGDHKVEASATKAKAEGTVESGNMAAKTRSTHSQPSSQVRMAIDDTIEQLLIFDRDETEASAEKAMEGRDVDNENITTKTAPNVPCYENSNAPFILSALLGSSTLISDAQNATEEFIQEATLALPTPEKSMIEDGTNVVADENSKAPFVPSAPLASSTCI